MEEKQMMTNEQLESKLKSLRVKETITKILTCCAAVAMIIMWFFMENLAMGLVFLVIAIVFGFLFAMSSSMIKKLLSDNIISGVLKEALGDNVEYNPWGKINPGSMVFPFSYNTSVSSYNTAIAMFPAKLLAGSRQPQEFFATDASKREDVKMTF